MAVNVGVVSITIAVLAHWCIAQQSSNLKGQLIETPIAAPSIRNNLFSIPDEQPIAVYLPPSYSSSKRSYPVVYYLTGFSDVIRFYTMYGVVQGFNLLESMDELIREGKIKEMIVVMPNGVNFMGGSFYVNSPVSGNWEDFIVTDVVRYVDNNYRTVRSSFARGISGHSMGGFGAINIAFHHPELFGFVYAMSPGLFAPGGLAKHVMFADTSYISDYFSKQKRLESLGVLQANLTFIALMGHQNIAAYDFLKSFVFAYGTAFAPNTTKKAPSMDYPYRRTHGVLEIDSTVWRRYENGFGGLEEKVRRYESKPTKLNAFVMEYGKQDEHEFIPQGIEYFATLLRQKGIACEVRPFEGHHRDRLRSRIEGYMLPFFSQKLKSE